MKHYLILARSVTYAQRMQKVLDRAGIRSGILHAPGGLTDAGCAYALRVTAESLQPAVRFLTGAGLPPMQIFFYRNGQYREVLP